MGGFGQTQVAMCPCPCPSRKAPKARNVFHFVPAAVARIQITNANAKSQTQVSPA